MPKYFRILKDNNWGFADAELNVLIPPAYKFLYGDLNGLVHFTQHNGLCGLLDIKNEILIPALYDYLICFEENEFIGCYKATINEKTGILSRNNEVVKGFE